MPLRGEREFEEVIMVEVLIEEMYGSECSRPNGYARAAPVQADKTDN